MPAPEAPRDSGTAATNRGPVPVAPRRPMRARRWFFAFGLIATLVIVISGYLSIRPLRAGRSEFDQVRSVDLARHQVGDLRTTLADWQIFAESHFGGVSSAGVKIGPVELARGATLAQTAPVQGRAVVAALRAVHQVGLAHDLETASAAFTKAVGALAPLVAGTPSATGGAIINAERQAFARMWNETATVTDHLKDDATIDLDQGTAHLEVGRRVVLSVDGALLLIAVATALGLGQRARRRELAERESTERHSFETVLQQALELSESEADVYTVLSRALPWSVPNLQVEMLIADSSRAHFRRTLTTAPDTDERTGCGVISPQACPATVRGHTLRFPSSRALDACPYLMQRPSGDCSAVCIPVSIGGKTVGVTHATGPDTVSPSESNIRYLETRVARGPRNASRWCAPLRGPRPRPAAIPSPGSSTAAVSRTRCVTYTERESRTCSPTAISTTSRS